MIGTYAAVLAVCGASLAIGQAAIGLCGRAALVVAGAGGRAGAALRGLLGDGAAARRRGRLGDRRAGCSSLASVAYLWGRLEGGGRRCAPAGRWRWSPCSPASLPFVVEGHFGILGTSFNPDMSQHLLAADRLADGARLAAAPPGLPARPARDRRRPEQGPRDRPGPGLQRPHGRGRGAGPADRAGRLREPRPLPRTAGALVVGLAYVVASYFAQGAFKETIAGALRPRLRARPARVRPASWRDLPLRFVPAALIAVGAVYAYSFPGLIWLVGACVDLGRGRAARGERRGRRRGGRCCSALARLRRPRRPRDRADDRLPQLRDLRPQRPRPRQPLRPGLALRGARDLALRRLPPRARRRRGAGRRLLPRRRLRRSCCCSTASSAAGAAARSASSPASPPPRSPTLAARIGGTAYTAAKAIEIAAPLVALTILLPLLRDAGGDLRQPWDRSRRSGRLAALAAAALRRSPPASARCSRSPTRRSGRPPTRRRSPGCGRWSPPLDPGPRLRPSCSPTSTATPTSPGSCAAGGSASSADERSRRHAAARRPLRRHPRRPAASRPSRACACAASRRPTSSGKSTGPVAAQSPCPLIAVRQARQGPRALRRAATYHGLPMEAATDKIVVTLPDGKPLELPDGRDRRRRRGGDRARASPRPRWRSRSTASCATSRAPLPEGGAEIAIVTDRDPEALELIRHDAAHVMAEAVMELYPGTKVTIGPPIESGFYYDFEFPADVQGSPRTTCRRSRRRCASTSTPTSSSSRRDVPVAEAIELFRAQGQDYKVELIEDLVRDEGVETVSLYRNGPFEDLCRGPHGALDRPDQGDQAELGRRRLLARRREPRELTRIYGTAFFSKKDLEAAPGADRGGEGPRPPPARPPARPLHAARRGAGDAVLAAQRDDAAAPDRGRGPRAAAQARLPGDRDPAGPRRGALAPLRATGTTTRTTCTSWTTASAASRCGR